MLPFRMEIDLFINCLTITFIGIVMKKHFLLLYMITVWLHLSAQTENHFVVEGKVWHEFQKILGTEYEHTRYMTGDTIINGEEYKKVYERSTRYQNGECEFLPDKYIFAMREENGRIYVCQLGSLKRLLYDFNLKVGDSLSYMEFYKTTVTSTDSIFVNGILRKRQWVTDEYYRADEYEYFYGEEWNEEVDGARVQTASSCWVEGIGSSTGLIADYFYPLNSAPLYRFTVIKDCYEDGVCIFTEQDFSTESITSGIKFIQDSDVPQPSFYNLQGRRLSGQPQRGGVYIQNRRKILR